ncbi:tetratricopeptide (TPR) repeat protein [Saccharothrix tamanrassetensis]|uniref:Tetratricopeptide (TPR) repeat protein n=1 Tax=Saccharothrix tamanrassetensis TaxID=1051531 RepID=A0A841CUG7_9PSEU|nr:tetratricopeptide repeat protein [Saccharothrix tamanrassetensis]MBB5959788.1 tetratricopeptide (TPR) repeat protein [Saccharothrix tamanrassetensis]
MAIREPERPSDIVTGAQSELPAGSVAGRGREVRNELTATVGGDVLQAGVVHGGVHFHQRSEVTPPRQLPAMPALFTGRARALVALDDTLHGAASIESTGRAVSPPMISVIGGAGGIGKTWLALCWAHRRPDWFPDGQLFVDLRGFSPEGEPMSPGVAVRGFLDALGVDPGRIPPDLDGQAALYRSLTADKRVLVVLDNAASTEQVEPLLPGGRSCAVVVTSRRILRGLVTRHGARHLALDVLSDDEARAALELRLGSRRLNAEPDATARLLALCRGFPLALAIVAGRAHTNPGLPLAHLVLELHESGVGALDDDDPTASLPAVFATSYRALTSGQQHIFRLLAIAPGPHIGLDAAASLTGLPRAEASRSLRALHEASLLDQNTHGRYTMHDLIRRYTNESVHHLPEAERTRALSRVVDHYLHTAHAADQLLYPHREPMRLTPPSPGTRLHRLPDAEAAMAWFDAEHLNLLAALHTAAGQKRHEVVWQLAWALDTFHYWRGHLNERVLVWQAALDAAHHLVDPAIRISTHLNLGIAHAVRECPEAAVEHLHQALVLAERHDDPAQQARTHQMLGWAWQWRGNSRRALDHATRALALHDTLDQPVRRADTLNQMGWYATRLGDHDIARAHFRAALALQRQHHNPDGEATSLDGLGHIAHHLGRHREAVHHYGQALALRRELGHVYGEADTLERLGHAHAALGEQDRAEALWREALHGYRQQKRDLDAARIRRLLDTTRYPPDHRPTESAR